MTYLFSHFQYSINCTCTSGTYLCLSFIALSQSSNPWLTKEKRGRVVGFYSSLPHIWPIVLFVPGWGVVKWQMISSKLISPSLIHPALAIFLALPQGNCSLLSLCISLQRLISLSVLSPSKPKAFFLFHQHCRRT